MAHIHRISGSTQYLLNGVKPIHGKKLATLDEIRHLYEHHQEILAETETIVSREQDKIILELSYDETKLSRELHEGIEKRTQEVDREMDVLNDKVRTARTIFSRTGYRFRHWIAVSQRTPKIHSPFSDMTKKLQYVQYCRRKRIENIPFIIKNECNNVVTSYYFLKNNQSFLVGAIGEEFVIALLSQLPQEYHVINDVNLHFHRAIYWREKNEYIKNSQIDHIVVGPNGIFLLETKNWKASDIDLKSDVLISQVRRSSLSLWYYLKDYYQGSERPRIRNVIVSMKSLPSSRKPDKYIDIVTPHQLCGYISSRSTVLSEEAIVKLVHLVTQT